MVLRMFWCWSTFCLGSLGATFENTARSKICWNFERAVATYSWTVTLGLKIWICVQIYETHATGLRYHIFTRNKIKASLAKRLIQTLNYLLLESMERRNSLRWLETLPQLTQNYNNFFHQSIRSTPGQAWDKTHITNPELWARQYLPKRSRSKSSGDTSRRKDP